MEIFLIISGVILFVVLLNFFMEYPNFSNWPTMLLVTFLWVFTLTVWLSTTESTTTYHDLHDYRHTQVYYVDNQAHHLPAIYNPERAQVQVKTSRRFSINDPRIEVVLKP